MYKESFEYKQNLYLKPTNGQQVNEAKLHRCALDWCERCAYCEFGYDELQSKELNSEDYYQFLLDKIDKSSSIHEGDFFKNCI